MLQITAIAAVGAVEGVSHVNWSLFFRMTLWWYLGIIPVFLFSAVLTWQGTAVRIPITRFCVGQLCPMLKLNAGHCVFCWSRSICLGWVLPAWSNVLLHVTSQLSLVIAGNAGLLVFCRCT